ncbi:Polycystic kidney disease protein 1-like 2 [Exaiptasia diaphana]|nr:Polycystic kidney disease protein 1-like 2 [Exaiptasia diaphana]
MSALVEYNLRLDIITRYVKITSAVPSYIHIGMRVEVYGHRETPYSLITSSDESVDHNVTSTGNLTNSQEHGNPLSGISWCPEFKDSNSFLAVTFARDVMISNVSVVTQSLDGFFMYYAPSGQSWQVLKYQGVTKILYNGAHVLRKSIAAQKIKFKPKSWQILHCVQVNLFGYETNDPLLQRNQPSFYTMTASSDQHPFHPTNGVFNLDNVHQGWCASQNDADQYLKIDLRYVHVISFIATQGVHVTGMEAWVSSYSVEYSEDDIKWRWHQHKGEKAITVFNGNTNSHLVVKNAFLPALVGRYVKIHPVTWNGSICLRAELYGYSGYLVALGMNTGYISDNAISSSASFSSQTLPNFARLHRVKELGGWQANSSIDKSYIEVDLGADMMITGISTQGPGLIANNYVTSYNVSYRRENSTWTTYQENGTTKVFPGNTNQFAVVTHILNETFISRFVRIIVNTWNLGAALRFELLGQEIPVIDGGFTEFTNWTTCNATCGGGLQSRTRNCTNPVPRNGGQNCTGPSEEIKACNIHLCPAPNVTTPKTIVSTNQLTNFTINNCNQSQIKTIIFGDESVNVTTNECTFQHHYPKPGIFELKISIPRHEYSTLVLYVQEEVSGLAVTSTSMYSLVREEFFINWKLSRGTLPHLVVNFTDGTDVNITVISSVYDVHFGNTTHKFMSPGTYNVSIVSYNLVSRLEIFTVAFVRIPIIISSINVEYHGIFDLYYQLDNMTVNVTLRSGDLPTYRYHMGNGVIISSVFQYLNYTYPNPGTYNLTVEVSNKASSDNITKVIEVYPVVAINDKAHVAANNTVISTPTLVQFDLDTANPYECIFSFGDGKSLRVLSTSNLTNVSNIYAVSGTYTITVQCSNALSSKTLSVVVVIQGTIKGLVFVNDGPKEMNETVTHTATAEDWGTDSCIYVEFGDGSSAGIGKQHCQTKYPGITFKEKNNSTFIFQNMYYKVKVFYTSIHAWNLLSEFKEQKRLPILKISCGYPNTSIVGLSTDIASPTNITRLTALTLESVTNVVCKATNIKVFSWTYFKTSTSKEKVGIEKSISTTESTFLQPSILDYGLHVVRFNVSMYKQAGIWSIADVFLDVVPNDLDVKIDGGQEIERAFDKTVYFDGGLSKDPDYPSKSSLFLHYWLITIDTSMTDSDAMDATLGRPIDDSPQYNEDDFCNMSLPRRLYKGSSRITLFTGKLEVNQTYLIFLVIKLSVSGVTRRNAASQLMTVVVGDPPVCNVRCSTNCKSKVILTDKYSLSASCEEESSKIITYSWEMHIQDASNQWLPLNNLQNLTSTALDNQNIVIKPNALLGGRKYRLIMKAKIVGRRTGRVSMPFIVNDPPYGGKCTVDFPSGLADHTNFTFNCFGWKDDDVPLTYEHSYRNSYGLATTLYYGFKTKITSMLPVGDPTSKFVIIVNARVYDSYRAYSEYQLPVEVKLPPTPKGALLEDLESDLSSNNSEAMKLLSNGKVQEFAQVVNAKMSIVNALSTSEKTEEGRKKGQEMRTNVLKNLHSVTVDSLQGINQIGPTFAATTIAKDEVPLDSQKLILESSETMVSLLDSSFEDGVGTSDVKEASTTLAFLMGNLMAASGDSAKVYGSQSPKDSGSDIESARKAGKEIAKQSTKLVHKMTKSLLNFKVAGEAPTVIKSPSMSIVVSRQQPSQMGNKTLGDGESQVDMPPSDEIFGDTMKNSSFVDAEFLAFPENHNTWDPSAEDVSSTVSLNLKTENSTEIKVDGLSKPFSMYIPRKVPELSPVSNATFIGKEMGSTAFHRYNWSMDSIPLHIIFLANYSDVIIDVYFKYKERPNVKRDPLYVTIPDQSFCTSDSSGLQKCSQEAYAILVNESIVKETGNYYLALKMKRPGGEPQSRTRRDCGTYKRQKRSCLKYKDPPERPPTLPPGVDISKATFVDNVPKYDPEKHMAYSLTTIYSPCKYWNEKKEVWTTNGCKVGKNTKLHAVHCLCNHLTQFGGGLLVAPNPIDFDQVWAGFGNISDNLAVLLTICTAFALYILIGVLVRKKDKKDLLKGGVTIIEIEDGRYLGANSNDYHITVQTGSWQNSATTAKVCMNIIGQKGQSGTLSLQDDTKHLFARGATNEFQVTLPSSLGPLQYLRVWHDMSGEDSSWYLSYVIIRDLNSQQQWIFVCDRWLALDKDDGLVDRLIIVSGDKELKNFKTLFRTKTSQDLFDGHLWLSVIGKPPKSSFTRLQRLSCCMSLLFTTMMTSAMFYNLPGGATDGSSVAIGPLRFSIRQLMIGIQSSFIALPVNVIIIQIFRKARPKPEKNDLDDVQGTVFEFDGISKCENKPEYSNSEEKQKQEGIPYWTVYIAWTLCFLMTLTSATITLFYSMMWGKEISEQWLTSMLVSFFQDAFVTQPIKVCGIALFVAAVLKTLPSDFQNASAGKKVNDEGTSSEASDFHPEACVDFEPPDPEMIEKARQHKLKENQMYGIMKENIFHAVFLLMLVVISYSDRDPMAYYQTNTLNNALSKEVQDPKAFWSYLYGSLLPFAYDGRTSKSDPDLEGYASDKNLYIVGMPRLRQLRVKKVPCSVRLTENICENFYSAFDEVQSFFLPGWKKNSNLTPSVCPEPWRYKGILELNGIPYWGQANFYGGGGYTANLGYNTDQANRVISELKLNKWIDDQTRAIFVELTVYNAYANLFSVLTHLVEMQGLGGSISLLRIETFRLYPNPGPNNSVVMISQFLVLAITFVMTYINCKKIFHLRKEYFQVFWNVIQLVIIILTFVCVGLVIVRKIDAERTIQKVYDNPFVFISFQYTTQWATVNTYVIALIVFLTTLKFLYLMRFNRNIVVLYKTVVRASPKLKLLSLEAFVLFASLVSFSYLYFGRYTNGFGSLLLTIQTLLAMMLGKAYFVELSLTDSILGPVFFVVFAVLMVFFLLNIFIAVLMDTYAEVSEETNLNNKEFEIADFMIQRLKVMVGVSKPIGQPWNVPRLEYIPGVDEETQRRLDLEKSIIDLPKKVQGIHRSLVDLESMSVDIDMAEKEIVEALASHYDTDSLSSEDDSTSTIVLELLQDDE